MSDHSELPFSFKIILNLVFASLYFSGLQS